MSDPESVSNGKNYQHKNLAAGRWNELTLVEQLAHVGSEISRALNWQEKNNPERARHAFERALELFDLTIDCPNNRGRLKEVCRVRELLVDYFHGPNEWNTTAEWLRKYFLGYAPAARRDR